jgi:hypothetical protein
MKSISKYSLLCGTIVLGLIISISFSGCKNFGVPDYKLTVTREAGVNGTPSDGETVYKELSEVEYAYLPGDSLLTVEVLINGRSGSSSGSIIMYADIDLVARIFNINGTWDIIIAAPSDTSDEDIEFTITFSGFGNSLLEGSFTDSRGYSGTWEITGTGITFSYENWQNFTMTGTIPSMAGTWEGVWNGENKQGSWDASR